MGEGEGGMIWENSIETCILSTVKQIASPGWMHETSARGWCTGKTQRDGVGREGASGWGTHVNPWLIHVNVWQKPLQYCKVISLQLMKINGKKKKNHPTSASSALVVGGHRLSLLWHWLVCLGNELRSFCRFWDCTQVLHFKLFCWLWGLLHFF